MQRKAREQGFDDHSEQPSNPLLTLFCISLCSKENQKNLCYIVPNSLNIYY